MFGSVEKSSCLLVLVSSCCAYFDAANWHTYIYTYIQRYCQNIYYTYIDIYALYVLRFHGREACGQRQRVMPHAEHKKLFTVFDNNFSMGHSLSLSHCIYSSFSVALFDSPPLSHSPFLWYLFIFHSGTGNLPRLIEKCFKNLLGLGLFKGVV